MQFIFIDRFKNLCFSVEMCYLSKVWAEMNTEYIFQLGPVVHTFFLSCWMTGTLPFIYPFCRCVLSSYLIVQLKRVSIMSSAVQFRHRYKLVDFIRDLSSSYEGINMILGTRLMLLSNHHCCWCCNPRALVFKPYLDHNKIDEI